MWERIYAHAVLLIFGSIILKAYCKGNGSLTFVIDDTGSMSDDIRQVRSSVDRLSNTVLNETSIQISNMVLVTFNDPDAKVRTVTEDRRNFQRILDAVLVYGGGDCWEPSMKGLLLALEKSNHYSYIYVFTDAAAKDYWDGRYVKAMCQKKQSQINFVLTGKCSGYRYPTESFDVFFDVAHACSGQAFFVPKKDVEQVLRTLEVSIKDNKTAITTTIVPAGETKQIPFTIDDYTDYAIVSVSGENVKLSINGPSSFNLERIMWHDNGKVVKLSNIKSGTYVATVMGHSRTSVVIVGRTDFFFSHGFSQQKPKSKSDTSLQPIAESKVHLSISVTDDHQSVQIVSAQILDMDEKPIDVPLPLTKISKDFYVTKLFVAPSQRFKVAVNGIVTATGKPIKRIGKIPITPQEPPKKLPDNTRPKVGIAEGKSIEIEYNSTMKLTCNVEAFPEPNIVWANMKGQVMPSKMSLKEYPYNYISYMDISNASKDDRYKCYATNKVGRDETTIDVKVKEPFIVKSTPSKITKLTYGTEGTINCDITSHLPLDIHWYYANERTGETRQITTSDIYEISENGTRLKIKKMDLNLVGRYVCKFSLKNEKNVQKTYLTRVEIDGLIAPKVQVPANVKVTRGKTAVFECKVVTGTPAPNITWLFGGKSGSSFTPIGSESVLRVTNVDDKHEGQYKCVAKNVVDKDEQISTLFVQDLPKITTSSFTVYQATEGDTLMRIPCIAAGVPKPVINWKLSGRYITPGKKYSIEDGTLIIRGPAVSDTNSYTCEAKNEVGVVSATFKTYIRQLPKISGVASKNVREGTPASIECMIVKGEPKPNITWQFISEAASNIVPIVGSQTTLHISNAAKTHTGRYKCIARNEVGSDEHITSLIVEFAPAITTNSSTIEGIEGDLGLRIPCDVVGVPKPVITWKLKGTSITSDAKYSIEDGALVIMNPTEKDTSSYTCEAKNNIGSVSVTFQAKVNKYPKNFGSEHNIYLKQCETRKLECEPYSSKSQSVAWFITRKTSHLSTTTPRPESSTVSSKDASSTPRTITQYAGKKEYIQITNASFSDHDGNYTCRVSDKHGNTKTYTYVVYVGNAPEFRNDENLISNWEGEIKDIREICYVNEGTQPIPVVQWIFNGKELSDISSAGVGHYTCNVSNVHGFALKKFDVKSSACLITRDLRDMPYMPLVLNDEGNWHTFKTTEHFTIIKEEEKITLSCPSPKETSNTFKKFPKRKTLEAFCIKENTFMVDHQTFSLSELQCSNNIQPSVIRNKVKCSTETSELISVGYNVPGFLKAYEVCFDYKINMPLYTRVIMTETNKKSPSGDYNWYTYPGIGSEKTKRGFTCKDTSSSCCYSKSQLVHAIDFNDGPAKKSTFIDPVNAIPVWLPCNTSKWSWEKVNDQVRTQLPVYKEFVVWSGTHTVQEKNGANVPRYLWKVVRLDEDEVMAIVYVNDPKPTDSDIKCKTPDVCHKYKRWMVSDNSIYCCSLPDFLKAFDIHVPSIGESMDAVLDEIEST